MPRSQCGACQFTGMASCETPSEAHGAAAGSSPSSTQGWSVGSEATAAMTMATAGPEAAAEYRWNMLLEEIEELSTRLSKATLRASSARLESLAAASRSPEASDHVPALASGADASQTESDACSIGSMGECSNGDETSSEGGAGDMRDEISDWALARMAALDDRLFGGARDNPWWNAWNWEAWPDGEGGDGGGAADGGASDGGDGVIVVAGGGYVQHDTLGLERHARRMYCDYHDQRGGCPNACMAVDMLQQRRINAVVEAQQRARRRKPSSDPDGREARYAMYRTVIKWQWSDPLGAGNRVRLPRCVLHRVRKLFPNPVCTEGGEEPCDYLDGCERRGHYTGFRTADESRAAREGRFDQMDLED